MSSPHASVNKSVNDGVNKSANDSVNKSANDSVSDSGYRSGSLEDAALMLVLERRKQQLASTVSPIGPPCGYMPSVRVRLVRPA
eukprot:7591946-Pyramimonas_sp.AAC.1